MEVKAKLRFVRVGPRKARLVADLIRGKRSEEALNILTFTKKAAAKIVVKLLKSAIANATQKKEHRCRSPLRQEDHGGSGADDETFPA